MADDLLGANLKALQQQAALLREDATALGSETSARGATIQNIKTGNTAGGLAKGVASFANAYTGAKSRAERLEQAKRIEAKLTEGTKEAETTAKLNEAVAASVPAAAGVVQGFMQNPDTDKLKSGLTSVAKNIIEDKGKGTVIDVKINPENPVEFDIIYQNDKGKQDSKPIRLADWTAGMTTVYGQEAAQAFSQQATGFNAVQSKALLAQQNAELLNFDPQTAGQQAAGFVKPRQEQVTGTPEDFAASDPALQREGVRQQRVDAQLLDSLNRAEELITKEGAGSFSANVGNKIRDVATAGGDLVGLFMQDSQVADVIGSTEISAEDRKTMNKYLGGLVKGNTSQDKLQVLDTFIGYVRAKSVDTTGKISDADFKANELGLVGITSPEGKMAKIDEVRRQVKAMSAISTGQGDLKAMSDEDLDSEIQRLMQGGQ